MGGRRWVWGSRHIDSSGCAPPWPRGLDSSSDGIQYHHNLSKRVRFISSDGCLFEAQTLGGPSHRAILPQTRPPVSSTASVADVFPSSELVKNHSLDGCCINIDYMCTYLQELQLDCMAHVEGQPTSHVIICVTPSSSSPMMMARAFEQDPTFPDMCNVLGVLEEFHIVQRIGAQGNEVCVVSQLDLPALGSHAHVA